MSNSINKQCILCYQYIQNVNDRFYCSEECYLVDNNLLTYCFTCGMKPATLNAEGHIGEDILYCSKRCFLSDKIGLSNLPTCKGCNLNIIIKTNGRVPKSCSFKCKLKRIKLYLKEKF